MDFSFIDFVVFHALVGHRASIYMELVCVYFPITKPAQLRAVIVVADWVRREAWDKVADY